MSFIRGKLLNFNGYQIEVMGEPKDNDGFIISPSMTKSGAMQFNLNNAEDFAASSKNLISKSSANVGDVELNLIGTTQQQNINHPPQIEDVFTSSTNPLVATSFLQDGPISTIKPSIQSINLSSIGNQSSGTVTISDADIKGFSSFKITLANGNEVNLSSAATDPGDGLSLIHI